MTNEEQPKTGFMLGGKLYDRLKFMVQILLPAFATLYFTLSAIWGLPRAEEVVGTTAAITTFLGVLLGLSTISYNSSDARFDGEMKVIERPERGSLYSLELNDDPSTLSEKKEIIFKVVPEFDRLE